jgi:hypothetical protein
LLPITAHTLDKLENLLKDLGYKVRYEKGAFKTAACLLDNHKVVVINKFSSLDARIGSLIALIRTSSFDAQGLSEKQKQFLWSIQQTQLAL